MIEICDMKGSNPKTGEHQGMAAPHTAQPGNGHALAFQDLLFRVGDPAQRAAEGCIIIEILIHLKPAGVFAPQ